MLLSNKPPYSLAIPIPTDIINVKVTEDGCLFHFHAKTTEWN